MAAKRQSISEEFIERINTDLDIFGIKADPSQPPMTETYLHVRRRQDGSAGGARLALPAFQGEKGDPGEPVVHQGDRTSAQLAALREALDHRHKNWAFRNADNNDMYVWNGTTFIVYENAFGAEGEQGPPPELWPGTVTIEGYGELDDTLGVRIRGSDGSYTVGLDLPKLPQGEQGLQGPPGGIYTSPDIEGGPTDGQILVHDGDSGKMVWRDGYLGPQLYSVPPSAFSDWSAGISASRHHITTVTIPAQPFRYRLDFSGGVEISSILGQTIDVQILADDPDNGTLVGCAWGSMEATGWIHQRFDAFHDIPVTPETTGLRAGVVEAGTEVELHVVAVKSAGLGTGWRVASSGRSNLQVKLERMSG